VAVALYQSAPQQTTQQAEVTSLRCVKVVDYPLALFAYEDKVVLRNVSSGEVVWETPLSGVKCLDVVGSYVVVGCDNYLYVLDVESGNVVCGKSISNVNDVVAYGSEVLVSCGSGVFRMSVPDLEAVVEYSGFAFSACYAGATRIVSIYGMLALPDGYVYQPLVKYLYPLGDWVIVSGGGFTAIVDSSFSSVAYLSPMALQYPRVSPDGKWLSGVAGKEVIVRVSDLFGRIERFNSIYVMWNNMPILSGGTLFFNVCPFPYSEAIVKLSSNIPVRVTVENYLSIRGNVVTGVTTELVEECDCVSGGFVLDSPGKITVRNLTGETAFVSAIIVFRS